MKQTLPEKGGRRRHAAYADSTKGKQSVLNRQGDLGYRSGISHCNTQTYAEVRRILLFSCVKHSETRSSVSLSDVFRL